METTIVVKLPPELEDKINRIEEMLTRLLIGDPEERMTGPQVQKFLRIGESKLRTEREKNRIRHEGEGNAIRYRRADVLDYAQKQGIPLMNLL